METSIERIHAKIAELEARIGDLRIAERELQALDEISAPRTALAPGPGPKQKPAPGAKQKPWPNPLIPPRPRGRPKTSDNGEAGQTIGEAIAAVLDQHGALSATQIAEHIKAAGRDINNRSVSFTLQALKKRGLVKNAGGKWQPGKKPGRRAAPASGIAQEPEPEA